MTHLYIFSTVEFAFHIPSKGFNVVCCVVDPRILEVASLKVVLSMHLLSTILCAYIPRKGFNVVCLFTVPKMLLTVILAEYTLPACSPMM